jgi:hypothetical protein
MQIKFLEIARIELDDAVSYYNHEIKGLGDKFLTETLKKPCFRNIFLLSYSLHTS